MIILKKIVDGSCNSEKFSYACIYFAISSWILGIVVKVLTILSGLYEKIKDWIDKRSKVVNADEVTQIKIVTTEKFDKTYR